MSCDSIKDLKIIILFSAGKKLNILERILSFLFVSKHVLFNVYQILNLRLFYSKEFYRFASQILLFPMLINISSERSSGAYVPTLPFRMGDSHFEKRAPVLPALSEMGYSRKKRNRGSGGSV